MLQEGHWQRQSDESTNSKRGFLRDLLEPAKAKQALVVYVAAAALIIFGGVYALWRISLLSEYLAANRAYVLERDERWERHIQGQAEITREILRRLTER